MAFASAVLMFAGSPQTLVGIASAQDSFLLFLDILSGCGRHLWQTLTQYSCRAKFIKTNDTETGYGFCRFSTPTCRPSAAELMPACEVFHLKSIAFGVSNK